MMEVKRGNRVSTRNQRLAALHTFYRYLALQNPEMPAELNAWRRSPSSAVVVALEIVAGHSGERPLA
jgi:hypothetical protein